MIVDSPISLNQTCPFLTNNRPVQSLTLISFICIYYANGNIPFSTCFSRVYCCVLSLDFVISYSFSRCFRVSPLKFDFQPTVVYISAQEIVLCVLKMASLSGILQRPLVTAAAVAVASVSVDIPDKFSPNRSSDTCLIPEHLNHTFIKEPESSWVAPHISNSKLAELSFVSRIQTPVPNFRHPAPNLGHKFIPAFRDSPVASPVLLDLYQSADLTRATKPTASTKTLPISPSDVSYRWHLPKPSAVAFSKNADSSLAKSRTVVVMLGWLGAKQKHMKRYAEWYTSMGFHVITFTLPMAEILSYQLGGKAEQHIDSLVSHMADWLEEEPGKNLIFHTFSNTGWLTYGAILDKFQKQDPSLKDRIRGCVVDSAPVATPDPQVWASGFSAAFLKKHSVATKGGMKYDGLGLNSLAHGKTVVDPKPAVTEAALLLVLEKFFGVILNLPAVNRRLSDVADLLLLQQPRCPQLYIYSSADRVIPVGCVESFIEEQRRAGHQVKACNFVSTPHVDHFRSDPKLYTSQLTEFLENHVLCKRSG